MAELTIHGHVGAGTPSPSINGVDVCQLQVFELL